MIDRIFLSYKTVAYKSGKHVVVNCYGAVSENDIKYYDEMSFQKFKSMIAKL